MAEAVLFEHARESACRGVGPLPLPATHTVF